MNGKSLFLYILQNHIHHCVQIAFIILKQHMILLEFTFLKWILQPKQEVETCNPSSRNSSHKFPQITQMGLDSYREEFIVFLILQIYPTKRKDL